MVDPRQLPKLILTNSRPTADPWYMVLVTFDWMEPPMSLLSGPFETLEEAQANLTRVLSAPAPDGQPPAVAELLEGSGPFPSEVPAERMAAWIGELAALPRVAA